MEAEEIGLADLGTPEGEERGEERGGEMGRKKERGGGGGGRELVLQFPHDTVNNLTLVPAGQMPLALVHIKPSKLVPSCSTHLYTL